MEILLLIIYVLPLLLSITFLTLATISIFIKTEKRLNLLQMNLFLLALILIPIFSFVGFLMFQRNYVVNDSLYKVTTPEADCTGKPLECIDSVMSTDAIHPYKPQVSANLTNIFAIGTIVFVGFLLIYTLYHFIRYLLEKDKLKKENYFKRLRFVYVILTMVFVIFSLSLFFQ